MCQIDERVYVRTDGHRSVFHDTRQCDRGRRRGKTCSDAKIRITEYRDPTSSPIPSSPVTPSYQTRTRRPSMSSRPSTREGPVTSLKPEMHIAIGSKKGKGKSYPTVSITVGKSHRSSMGSTSAFESPDSEASHAVRTGFPDAPAPPLTSTFGGFHPRQDQYRNPSSDESLAGPHHGAPAYHYSDEYDTPSLATGTTATSNGARPVIHHGPRHVPGAIDTTRGQSGSPSNPYRTAVVTPRGVYDNTCDRTDPSQRSSSSYAPEIIGRDEDRQRRREEQRRRQEDRDRENFADVSKEESRRVHFEPSRAKDRAEQRADKTFAGRAEGREQLRQQERKNREAAATEAAAKEARQQEKRNQEAQAAKEAAAREAAARKPKPTTTASKPPGPSRRNSTRMTSAEAAKQQQLIQAEERQMRKERINAEALEREEQTQQARPTLQQQQQDLRYFDPRGGHNAIPGGQPSLPRRNSLSAQPRPDLTRSGSTRTAHVDQSRQDRRNPPVSFLNNFSARPEPQPRERRPSSSHDNKPFNPFSQPVQPIISGDPWDVRNVREALPSARGPQVGHTFPYPQQASQRMNQAFYKGEYETDSEEEYHRKKR